MTDGINWGYDPTKHYPAAEPAEPPAEDWSIADLLSMELPAEDWIVQDMIPVGGLSMIVGPPKAGKSTMARALCVAVGGTWKQDWLGRAIQHCQTLYVAMEGRLADVQRHFVDMKAMEDDLIHVAHWRGKEEPLIDVAQLIEKVKPKLVILDPLFRFANISDGNSYAEVTAQTQPLIDLAAQHNAAIVVVHHSRKGGGSFGEEVLGSQGLFGALDTLISVTKDDDGRHKVRCEEMRAGEPLHETYIDLDEYGYPELGDSMALTKRKGVEDKIRDLLASGPYSGRGIAREIGGNKKRIWDAINAMLETGELIREGDRNGKIKLA